MTDKSILRNHSDLEKNIKALIKFGLEIITENFSQKSESLDKKEKLILIESLLLRSCAHWENFLEKEIVFLINLDSKYFKFKMGLPDNTKLNLKLITAIMYGDKYKDFHDVEHHKSYFSRLLSKRCNPFPYITKDQRHKINFTYTIRNYLSHYSEFSKKKLHNAYTQNYHYKIFQEPGVFLLKEKGKYFESLLHNFILVSVKMKTHLGVVNE